MSNNRTILLYTDESTAGGVAQYNQGLLPAMVAAGWQTFSAQPQNASPMLVEQRALGVQQHFLSYDPCTTFTRSFTDTTDPERIMAEVKPDLVYFSDCCPISNIAAKHVAITRKIPFVVISHSAADYLAQRFPACLPTVKQQLAHAREIIAVSQRNLEVLHTCFGLAQNRGHVVLNGRPAAFFKPSDPEVRRRIRAELAIPDDAVLCFTSARFDNAKGYQHQLAAIRQLLAENALGKLYFAWAGIGDLQQEFAQAVKNTGLDSRIRLLGQRWDIAALLDASDLFVLTTMLEGGLPLSVMEAMAKGVGTIVTSVSGIAGVAQGACHLLPDANIDPNETAKALANALKTLVRDPAQRAKLSQIGRTLAEKSFRQETNLTQTLAILESSIPPPAAPTRGVSPAAEIPAAQSAAEPAAPPTMTKKEAFLLKPDFSGQEWQKIILAYLGAFSHGDPVGLILDCVVAKPELQLPVSAMEKILDVIRCSGKEAFADIILIEKPDDLVASLREYQLIHRLPFAEDTPGLSSSAKQHLLSSLSTTVWPKNPPAAPIVVTESTPRPVTAPATPRRLLTIIDFVVQPYSIGDFIVYLMGSLAAANEAGVEKIDICLLSDPTRPPVDPIMRDLVNADNHYSHLIAMLPLVQLNPHLGSLFVFDSGEKLDAFLTTSGNNYTLWPSPAELQAKKYMFYEGFKRTHAQFKKHDTIPRLHFNRGLTDWAMNFFQRQAPAVVPVTINLRNNPQFHAGRNYVLPAWKSFFERCQNEVPVKFIITCAASEVDPSLRSLPNVVFAKDHHTDVMQDLALIRFAAFHLGSSSGPVAIPIFGTKPYHIFNGDMLPHLHLYGGAMFQNPEGELQFSFGRELQSFGVVPETADGIWQQFDKIWTSRDWAATWSL